jgi:hypothetical protein
MLPKLSQFQYSVVIPTVSALLGYIVLSKMILSSSRRLPLMAYYYGIASLLFSLKEDGKSLFALAENSVHDSSSDANSTTTTGTDSLPVLPMTTSDPWYWDDAVNSHSGYYDEFWDELECDDVLAKDQVRPIHSQSTWVLLRGVYSGIVGPNNSTIDAKHLFENGFRVPFKVEHVPGKGRGVIALEDIPEGTFVWEGIQTARFPSPVEYRRFLMSTPYELACDILGLWAYTEEFAFKYDLEGTRRGPVISVDLDEGSFVNTADATTSKNIDDSTYRATRLIKAGEELIVDYGAFEEAGSWEAAGFGSATMVLEENFGITENNVVEEAALK